MNEMFPIAYVTPEAVLVIVKTIGAILSFSLLRSAALKTTTGKRAVLLRPPEERIARDYSRRWGGADIFLLFEKEKKRKTSESAVNV